MFLNSSDTSAGSGLSVPQLTAVPCHYPVFLLMSLSLSLCLSVCLSD